VVPLLRLAGTRVPPFRRPFACLEERGVNGSLPGWRGQSSNLFLEVNFLGWLNAYLAEQIVFPNSKYDDQVDSTIYTLAWSTAGRSIIVGRTKVTKVCKVYSGTCNSTDSVAEPFIQDRVQQTVRN